MQRNYPVKKEKKSPKNNDEFILQKKTTKNDNFNQKKTANNNQKLTKPSPGNTRVTKKPLPGNQTVFRKPSDNMPLQEMLTPLPIQTKLKTGSPGDKYEQEADNVSKQIMQKQTFKNDEETSPVEVNLHAKGNTGQNLETPPGIERVIKQKQGKGKQLGPNIRSTMEEGFNTDFNSVRIHDDSEADVLNRSLGAEAFTLGNDIFFKQGGYNPASNNGRELIAHELAHVVQGGYKKNKFFDNTIMCRCGNQVENPTFSDARDQLREYFERKETYVKELIKMKKSALELFTKYTDKSFDENLPIGLEILLAAFEIVPIAGYGIQVIHDLMKGTNIALKIIEGLDKWGKSLESKGEFTVGSMEKGKKVFKLVSTVIKPSETPVVKKVAFEIKKIEALADMEIDNVAVLWWLEDEAIMMLYKFKYAPANINLLLKLHEFGVEDIPKPEDILALKKLGKAFELLLYKEFYKDSGILYKVNWIEVWASTQAPTGNSGWYLEGVSSTLVKRILSLEKELKETTLTDSLKIIRRERLKGTYFGPGRTY
jgi:hypothetical protein